MTQKIVKIDRSKLKKRGTTAKLDAADKVIDAKTGEIIKDRDPGPRQQSIPGTQPHHPELARLAEVLGEKKEAARLAGREKKNAAAALIAAMKKHNCPSYVDRGLNIMITIDTKDRVSVKTYAKPRPARRRGRR